MIRKQIIATSGIDCQNQQLSLKILTEYAETLRSRSTATRMGINHDCTMLPVGKVLSGSLKRLDNGEIALEALIDDFADAFLPCKGPDGETLYYAKSSYDSRPFVDFQSESRKELTVLINPLNFDQEDYNGIVAYLHNQCDAKVETTFAKSLIPTPEVVFCFATGYLIAILGKQTLSKTMDKLSDAISDDLLKCYTSIKKAIGWIAKKMISCGQTAYIFTEPNQPIELVVKARKGETVLIALNSLKEYNVFNTVQRFNDFTDGNLNKIQFVYDETEGKWEMSYLTTVTGQVIGTEKSYRRTVQMYRSTLKSPTAGFSVGGTATFSNSEDVESDE